MNSWCQSCPRLHCATGHSIKYQVDARFHYNPRSPKRSQDWCVANKIECEQLNCRKWIALSGCLCVCLLVIKRNNVVQLHVDTADNHKIGPPSSLTTLTRDPLYVGGIPGRLERTDALSRNMRPFPQWFWRLCSVHTLSPSGYNPENVRLTVHVWKGFYYGGNQTSKPGSHTGPRWTRQDQTNDRSGI